ncbi:MAG: D-Ala-D-Ala carboxypeptidase family metallohydrolase [Pseudomonadota bacterium]
MLFETKQAAQTALGETWRWPNFTIAELACRCRGQYCGGRYWHDPDFLDALQALRSDIGKPLRLTSGHRCSGWNAAVGGAEQSRHKTIAVDIALYGHDRFALLNAAEGHGFTGIGLTRSFIHLDRREHPARWYYKRSHSIWRS